jgi:hypothetical protein
VLLRCYVVLQPFIASTPTPTLTLTDSQPHSLCDLCDQR